MRRQPTAIQPEIFRVLQLHLLDLGESFQVHCCWKTGNNLLVENRLDEYVAKHSCVFCARQKERPGGEAVCMEHDRKTLTMLLDAREESFEARCPAGATELVIPFRRQGLCLGAVLCGPYRKPSDPADPDLTELGDSRVRSLEHIIRQLLEDTIGEAYADRIGTVRDKRLERAVRYIRKNFRRPLSAAEAAEAAGLSRSRFLHLFPAECGMTFGSYLGELRLRECRRLLREEHLTLGEIAYELGFHSQSHFNLFFRKGTGETPKQYRTRLAASGMSPDGTPDRKTKDLRKG